MTTLQILKDNVEHCIDDDGAFEPNLTVLDKIWQSWAEDNSYADLIADAVNGDEEWSRQVAIQTTLNSPMNSSRLRWATLTLFRDFARQLAEEHAEGIVGYWESINAPDYDDIGEMI